MGKRRQSNSDGAGLVILVLIAVLWWLRWVILTAAVIALVVVLARWSVRLYHAHCSAERARLREIRQRADIQNAQVLRGDPHGFYGRYPLPDPELIPRWYRAG